MLHSILLLGSCYNKNKKLSSLFSIILFLNILFVQIGKVRIEFLLCNLAIITIISLINKKITNKNLKIISSSMSILIWSILIDIVSYYMFPLFNTNINIINYIINGILFNFKYVLYNVVILFGYNIFEYIVPKIHIKKSNQIRTDCIGEI